MELLIGSFMFMLLGCVGLAVGQFFGRPPLTGGCRPEGGKHCANTENCSLRCLKRKMRQSGVNDDSRI
jgi:hypothetical protein